MTACALALLAMAAPTSALTPIGGNQLSNAALTNAGSPYVVTSDLVILNGSTLSMEAGVVVYVDPGVHIIVRSGRLRTLGTPTSPVRITSSADNGSGAPAPGDWGELRFETGTNDAGTRLDWTEIRYGAGVVLQGASPTFNACSIANSSGPAISMDLASFPKGEGNSASGNALNGVQVAAGDITAPGKWELKGIPFVLLGKVSVGQSPALSGIAPNTVQQLDTVNVVLTGQRLSGATAFQVSGLGVVPTIQSGGTATSQTVQLVVDETAAVGARSISLLTPAGTAAGDDAGLTLTILGPTPVLTAISPTTVVAGQGDFTLTANGQRFATGVELLVGGAAQPTTRLSATQLTADVAASMIAAAGSLQVLVRNPDPVNPGNFLQSLPKTLTVQSPQIALTPDPLGVISGQVANLILSVPVVAPAGGFVFNLASSNAAIASVPATVTVLQGSSSAAVPVTGGTAGSATLTATRVGFLDGMAQIDVVPPPILLPITPVLARSVGVVVSVPPGPTETFSVTPLQAVRVGVVYATGLLSLVPDRADRGGSGLTVTANGIGLDAVTAVTFEPPDDITINGSPVVAPDGSSLTFDITIASAAAATPRQVVLQTPTGTVRPAAPGGDVFLVTRGVPQIHSVEPFNVLPGSIHTLVVRGLYLEGSTSLQANPPAGVNFGPIASIDTAGTVVTLPIQIDAAAALGPRVITISASGGTSTAAGTPANTLNVVADLGTTFTPLLAPVIGVVVTEAPLPTPTLPVHTLLAQRVGTVVGTAITSVNPDRANVGSIGLDVTIEGVGLDATTGVSFQPATGITINGAPTVAPDGSSITVNVDIDIAAPTGLRQVLVAAAGGNARAATPLADRFNVTYPPPLIDSLIPNRGLAGTTVPLAINGTDLNGTTVVSFDPPTGISTGLLSVNPGGTQVTLDILIAAGAPLGLRTVRVTTPGGMSAAAQSPANAFEVTDQVGTSINPVIAPVVGVVITEPIVPTPDLVVLPLLAPVVGVEIPVVLPPEPDFTVAALQASSVGVVVGAAMTGIAPATVEPGAVNVDVTIEGIALDAATEVQFQPATGITINGAPTVAPDGSSVVVNISLAIDAPRGYRQVLVLLPSGPAQPTVSTANRIFVGNLPALQSIIPNTVAIGSSFTLTINGTDLDRVTRVDFLPPDDVLLGPPTANGAGTQITVDVQLAGTITPGARVVIVTTLAGSSTSVASPANTMNIVGSRRAGGNSRSIDVQTDRSGETRVVTARPWPTSPGPQSRPGPPSGYPDLPATIARVEGAAPLVPLRGMLAWPPSGCAPATLIVRGGCDSTLPADSVPMLFSDPVLPRPPTSHVRAGTTHNIKRTQETS